VSEPGPLPDQGTDPVIDLELHERLHRDALGVALRGVDWSLEQLWMSAFALGSMLGLGELEAYLAGLGTLSAEERDILAQAMNERLAGSRPPAVPRSRLARLARPASGPLAALAGLLEGGRHCPPERLVALIEAAAGALDVRRIVIYLADDDQHWLTPVPSPNGSARAPLRVDGTLAGRAFQTGQVVPAVDGREPRYWLPLINSDTRLGVLDVMLVDPVDLRAPGLRAQCQWLADLLGHVLAGVDSHGDHLQDLRQLRPRTPGAELIWALLPPLTAGVDGFIVSGLLAPTDDLGGDIFDYALAQDRVRLAIFDAMGHGMGAGLIGAAAVSAYRAARHAGLDLPGQAVAINQSVAELFPDAFATGILAELDLTSGRLRYLNAGHPPPLVVRGGKVVGPLGGPSRPPFGLSAKPVEPAEEVLEPGDWLALHTDGVTEARDATGAFFGDSRFRDLLERAAAAGLPAPETVRRLLQAVLAHQDGVLQDDATLLLARWTARDDLLT